MFTSKFQNIQENILFEDKEIIVCHKPAGLAVQNARIGAMDMESALKNYLAQKNPGKVPYLGIIHRLDQPVEGIIVFAKTQKAAAELSRQIAQGKMDKYYLAVSEKKGESEEAVLEDYLLKNGKTNTSSVVNSKTNGAKKARLSYKFLKQLTGLTNDRYLYEIHLDTGRHHQIRVQMAHAGMPLAGDKKYNPSGNVQVSLGLCSYKLMFLHPASGEKMDFSVTPQGDAFCEKCEN